jgi:putative SOS response-associated peptidase YedK
MCGRYMLTSPVEALRQLVSCSSSGRTSCRTTTSRRPRTVPIVRLTRDGAARELITVRWALVPFWADDLSIGNRLINARCETVHAARAFREANSRRGCLLAAEQAPEHFLMSREAPDPYPDRETAEAEDQGAVRDPAT